MAGFLALADNYVFIRAEVANFNNGRLGARTSAEIADFVDRLLPKHVRNSAGFAQAVGEQAEQVTLLFADIVGFTQFCAARPSAEVVRMLSALFTAFDRECCSRGLYKVYTVGDCYVAMSFLDKDCRKPPRLECLEVVELAFKMVEIVAQVRKETGHDLHMRIGIHTGTIIGGVIGTGIIRYDLYGQDVLIANRLESSGQPDRVHVSQAARDLVESWPTADYRFVEAEAIFVAALDRHIATHFIEKTAN